MDKKYELTENTRVIDGHTLYQIRALRDFANVKAGDLGGFVDAERNLSHVGNCWLTPNAAAYDMAFVGEHAQIWGAAVVYDQARVLGSAALYDRAIVRGFADVRGAANVHDDAVVEGSSYLRGSVTVRGNARVCGAARLRGGALIATNAHITNADSAVWFENVGSENGTLTVYCGKKELMATRGCFVGTLDEFCRANANRPPSQNSERYKREYELLVEMARLRLAKTQSLIFAPK